MKKILMIAAGLMLGTVLTYAQDISAKQVPSVVLNNFKKEFPKASDIEWELKGAEYEADFEIGLAEHEAWFDAGGKLVKHTEDLNSRDLPQEIQHAVKKDYDGYRVSDVKRITTGSEITYQFELEKGQTEWKVTYTATGTALNKQAD